MTDPLKPTTRRHRRHIFEPPVSANYGAYPVMLTNISVAGLQLEHAAPLRLNIASRISVPFPRTTDTAELRGAILWSHLSRKPNREGKYLYLSGIHLEESADIISEVTRLMQAYGPRVQSTSGSEAERQRSAPPEPVMRAVPIQKRGVDPDRVLLIRQVADRLKQNPTELNLHASRARSALSIKIASVIQSDEVLAVWEYLQRVISLEDIEQVLTTKR